GGARPRPARARHGPVRGRRCRGLAAWRGGEPLRSGARRRGPDRDAAGRTGWLAAARGGSISAMSERASARLLDGLVDRTLANLRTAWREIAASARIGRTGTLRPDLPEDDAARLRRQMLACLDPLGGEVTARARAAALGRTYLALNHGGRERFLRILAEEFDTDRE